MSDEKINAFIRDLRTHSITLYACFKLTEYGGAGDQAGNAWVSDRPLKASLADALMQDQGRRPARGGGRMIVYIRGLSARARAP